MFQDMAKVWLDFFCEDSVLNVVKQGLRTKQALLSFTGALLSGLATLCPSNGEGFIDKKFAQLWNHDAMSPLRSGVERLVTLCSAIHCLFCVETPRGCLPYADKQVHYITEYKGQELLEKTFKRIFSDEQLWWIGEVNEMAAKGATTALHQSQLFTLQDLMNRSDPNQATIEEMTTLLKDISKSMRSQMMSGLLEKFSDPQSWKLISVFKSLV